MKKLLILIIGITVAVPAISQTDSLHSYVLGKDSILFPQELIKLGVYGQELLHMRIRKAKRQEIIMGAKSVYFPETDFPGGNLPNQKAAIIIYQIPIGATVTQANLDSISAYIRKLTEPTSLPQPKPDIVTDIDNVENINVYDSTDWQHRTGTAWLQAGNFFNVSASYNSRPNATIETPFTGYKIEWYTEKHASHGKAGVSIDGGQEVIINLYDPTTQNNSQLVWTSPILTNGPHTIKIRVTGEKSDAATGVSIIHDYLKVYRKQ